MRIHVESTNIDDLLNRGVRLRVFAGCDPTAVMAEGELISYCSAPSVSLRHRDGTKTSWSTDLLMEVVEAEQDSSAEPGWIVAREGGRYCESCDGEVQRGHAYQLQPGTGGLLQHIHCPDQGEAVTAR